jgi:hypothetical protein
MAVASRVSPSAVLVSPVDHSGNGARSIQHVDAAWASVYNLAAC